MTDTPPPADRSVPPGARPAPAPVGPRWMRVLLVLSLALNLLVAGLLLGDAIAGGGPGRGPRPAEMALGPLARALDEDDRRAILRDLRGRPGLQGLGRNEREQGLREIAAALRADPFDPERTRLALAAQSEQMAQAQATVQEALIARLAAMSPEARKALADRIEKGRGR